MLWHFLIVVFEGLIARIVPINLHVRTWVKTFSDVLSQITTKDQKEGDHRNDKGLTSEGGETLINFVATWYQSTHAISLVCGLTDIIWATAARCSWAPPRDRKDDGIDDKLGCRVDLSTALKRCPINKGFFKPVGTSESGGKSPFLNQPRRPLNFDGNKLRRGTGAASTLVTGCQSSFFLLAGELSRGDCLFECTNLQLSP